jgi:hypothetical protein
MLLPSPRRAFGLMSRFMSLACECEGISLACVYGSARASRAEHRCPPWAVPGDGPEAHSWSLYGALLRATGGDDFQSQTSDTFDHVVMCLLDFS